MHDGGTALAPWCAQAQQCSDASDAARIVREATEAPDTSVFGELIAFPAIQAVRRILTQLATDPTHAPAWHTLQLFATGTWSDYAANTSTYMPLTEAQVAKLRQLTILSLAHRSRVLCYAELQRALGLDTPANTTHATRTLEDLVIDGIYQSFFVGRLDGLAREFYVDQVTARDVPRAGADGGTSEALAVLHTALKTWAQRAKRAVHTLDEHIAQSEQASRTRAQTREANHDALVRALTAARTTNATGTRAAADSGIPTTAEVAPSARSAVRRSKRSRA
ncbi:hypothetical protein MBRA1_002471 [Malassezia brasiliensis]|uniref:PCI domain-containing protein n=1 Tax=Malassezia brasiliensis TaxID=1821822 RepID=A0AAF0DUU9_9BASI|nr:hypothetical protein MBRA1_002471 [Malassezia brasiliensis]